jgi:putative hydrolase of HD superfamily
MQKNEEKDLVKYFFELGQMRRTSHTGWTFAGVKQPTNIAEHTLRVVQIGNILARIEGADPAKTVQMLLIHDNGEIRTNDANRIVDRYIDIDEAEKKAVKEQHVRLPEELEKEFNQLFEEYKGRKSKESICAKDADYLDMALTAKEYIDIGYKSCQDIVDNVKKALKTKTAKNLVKTIEETEFNEWWQGLKKLPKDHK